MTAWIDNNIDDFIRRVKQYPAVSDFIFMMAHPARNVTTPIKQYTVAVSNEAVKESGFFVGERTGAGTRGRIYEIQLRLRMYAPTSSSGSALLRASSVLMDAIECADTERVITSVSVGGIAFDNTTHTTYRDISVSLEYLLCKEDKA